MLPSWSRCSGARSRGTPPGVRLNFRPSLRLSSTALIHALDDSLLHRTKRPHFGHAVPGVGRARFAADGFIAFEEARHEEFLCQRREFDSPPRIVSHGFLGLG